MGRGTQETNYTCVNTPLAEPPPFISLRELHRTVQQGVPDLHVAAGRREKKEDDSFLRCTVADCRDYCILPFAFSVARMRRHYLTPSVFRKAMLELIETFRYL